MQDPCKELQVRVLQCAQVRSHDARAQGNALARQQVAKSNSTQRLIEIAANDVRVDMKRVAEEKFREKQLSCMTAEEVLR